MNILIRLPLQSTIVSMSTIRVTVDPDDPQTFPKGKMDLAVVDATTEEQIALQRREDDEEAMNEARAARRGPPTN